MPEASRVADRVVFFVSRADYESAWTVTSTALTAVAMGSEVVVVFAFDALRALAKGTYGKPASARHRSTAQRAKKIGAASPQQMLADARSLGCRLIACDTTARLAGLRPEKLANALDDVLGLPQIWRLTADAKLFNG
jgi:peroxiredoxin family protein